MLTDAPFFKAQTELDTFWNQLYEHCVVINENYIYFFTSPAAETYYRRSYLATINHINAKYSVQLFKATQDIVLNNTPHPMSIQSWRPDWESANWEILFPPEIIQC